MCARRFCMPCYTLLEVAVVAAAAVVVAAAVVAVVASDQLLHAMLHTPVHAFALGAFLM